MAAKSAVHAARLVMHSVSKWVVTMMLMALSFGVVGADPISFFVTFVIAQLSFVAALVRPQLLRSNSQSNTRKKQHLWPAKLKQRLSILNTILPI